MSRPSMMHRRSILSPARLLAPLLGVLLVACSGHPQGDEPVLQSTPAPAASAGKTHSAHFRLSSASASVKDGRSQLDLVFDTRLAAAQSFDQLVAVNGPSGEAVSGSWSLGSDGTTLSFPFVNPDRRYSVEVKPGLLAADGRSLGETVHKDIYSGNLPGAVGFASHGSVLPARGTRGLPLVSVNVHDADIEF